MTEPTYQIELTGDITEYADRAKVLESFGKLFKLEQEKVEQTFAKAPVIIKKGVTETEATQYKSALQKIGAVARVIPPDTVVESANENAGNMAEVEGDESPTQRHSPVKETLSTPVPVAASEPVEGGAAESNSMVSEVLEEQRGFKFNIEGRPDYAFLTVNIPAGETLKVEASAMATMDTHLVMKTKMKGGLGRLLTSESIFINEFTAENGAADIGIAPGAPGDLGHVYLDGDTIYLQNSAFVAADMRVNVETKWQGLTKGFFSGESLFLIRCSGEGDLWFNTYGAMIELDVDGDYVVDTGNIVAFTEGLDYKITKVSGYKSLFFSGEGFVCRFSGKGRVWMQTRGVQAFTSWVYPFRPVKKSN